MGYLAFIRTNARWLAAGFLLTLISGFGQTYFISIFAGDIRAEFGLSHGAWGGIYSLGTGASAVAMLWAGTLTDVFRVRVLGPVVLFGLALLCAGVAVLSSAWWLPLVIFGLRFFGQGMAGHVAGVAMARWFAATRGRALAVASLGFSAGEAFLPMLFVGAMGFMAWHDQWIVAAVCALAAIPLLGLLTRHERTPRHIAATETATGMDGRHWTRREVLGTRLFWLTVPLFMGMSTWGTALFFQQVHLAEAKGWSHADYVTRIPAFTATAILTMVVAGWAIDRFGSGRLLPVYQLPMAAAFILLWWATDAATLMWVFVLFGVSQGVNAALPGAFWAEYFGTRHLGGVKSLAAAVMVLGSAIGPGITGALIDLGLPFPAQAPLIAALVVGASACGGLALAGTSVRLGTSA